MGGILSNTYNNIGFALSLHTEQLARLQEQISTGSRINRASDDPSAAYRVLGLGSQNKSLENYITNLSETTELLNASSIGIDNVKFAIVKAKELMASVSGLGGGTTQDVIKEGINELLEQVLSLSNTKHMNQYLFSGSNTTLAPYVAERTNGKITAVTYQGGMDEQNIEVAPGVQAHAFYVGNDIFCSNDRSDPLFTSETGAAAGTGTSTVKGDVWLTVTGSTGNYTLSIDGGLSTFNTNGTDTNLAVTHSQTGEILYVDTTNITNTGTEWVRVPGTYDIFSTLINIRDKLEAGELNTTELEELRSNALEALGEVHTLLVQKSVSVGSKIGFLENVKDSLYNVKFNIEDEITRLEEADIAQIAIDLARREVLYQMSLSVAGRIMSISLLDFIR